MAAPHTKYVTVGGAQVAYQVSGTGPDLIFCHSLGWQLDLSWHVPFGTDFLGRLRRVRRLIDFDRRGSGASDPVPLGAMPTWEELAEDLTAVLDDVESERTAVMGIQESGPIALLFAAMHPERVSHLILMNTAARSLVADDYPFGWTPEAVDSLVEMIATTWGTEDFMRMAMPTGPDADAVSTYAQMARASATPRSAAAQFDYVLRHVDVRSFLPLVQAPTLIFHSTEALLPPIEHARYLAEHLPRATLIEWPGSGLSPPDFETTASDIVEFLTGERPVEIDRILTTVLFTDIIGSTERAASVGDQSWRSLLDSHDRVLREQVRRFKGREVNTTGDGFVVSFDGPARAIRCAQAINEAMRPMGLDLRMGLHTGECEVRGHDLGGLAVHIAARIGALGTPQEILVSGTLKDLVIGSGIEFTERGAHDLKGVPGTWSLFAVAG